MFLSLKNILIAINILLAISVLSDELSPNITSPTTTEIKSLMLVGNSFFYYNNSLHNYLGKIIDNDPEISNIKRRSITINGSSLSWHDIDAYLSNPNMGNFKIDTTKDNSYIEHENTSIDAVIIMDCSLCPIHPKTKDSFHEYVEIHSNTIRNNDAEPILFMSWGYKNKPEMYKKLKKEFLKAANNNNLLLVPVGEAFHLMNKLYPEINLYTSDNRHPSKEGTFLAANVVFATLLGRKTEGNRGIAEINPTVAKKIQKIADKTVSEFFKIQLKQNHD